ncbi:hypothetical protein AX16_000488 [Volvariella volvacea WC 439]|nr:hypothetical protein AX16_000488 [Volvariella volvacea WC 439]
MARLSRDDILLAAATTCKVLAENDLPACLVGSAACAEHGSKRTPNDVDILVMSNASSAVEIKALIMLQDHRFCLSRPHSSSPEPLTVLWFILTPPKQPRRACKVDIFLPGTVQLPPIPAERFTQSPFNIPLMPFPAALLHKLLAWRAHGQSPKPHSRVKQANDVNDIKDLLTCLSSKDVSSTDVSWMPASFLQETTSACIAFVTAHPETRDSWSAFGFATCLL